jgi:hypothetical protein
MESPQAEQNDIVVPKNFPGAVVYVLQCIDNYYYIGSTVNHPRYRLNNHKKDSIKFPERFVYDHILKIGWPNVQLQVIEEYPCYTRKELYLKEDEYIKESIQDPYCLNHNRALLSAEEHKENMANYYLTHRAQILEQHKGYLQANKEKVDAYQAQYRKDNAEDRRDYSRKYAAEHPEQVAATRKAYYNANKIDIIEKQKAYNEENREHIQARKKVWAENNARKLIACRNKYVEENKEAIQARGKEYYEKNKDALKEKFKVYREANKETAKEYSKKYREQHRDKLTESHICECGGKYSWTHEDRHKSSKRHIKFRAISAATNII